MKIVIFVLIAIFQMSVIENDSISKNGMTVQWEFVDEDKIKFTLKTPSTGWAAIGLNTKNSLVGSNLIMATASDRGSVISDRFVVGFGNHQSMKALGVSSKVELLSASVENGKTTIIFEMETEAEDKYHFQLRKGQKIHMTIAYSQEDDFNHHSAMRTSVEIIL